MCLKYLRGEKTAGCAAAEQQEVAALQQTHTSGCMDKGCMCVPHGPDVGRRKESPPGTVLEAIQEDHPEG